MAINLTDRPLSGPIQSIIFGRQAIVARDETLIHHGKPTRLSRNIETRLDRRILKYLELNPGFNGPHLRLFGRHQWESQSRHFEPTKADPDHDQQ